MKSKKGRIDLEGMCFGRLRVLFYYDTGRNRRARWFCECACGNFKVISSEYLINGKTKSCGCINKPHGKTGTRLHRIWKNMMGRCHWAHQKTYNTSRYKDRGISVCEEWHNFEVFFNWAINSGYADTLTIDRIDNNGNYEPKNCRWVTRQRQSNNMSSNHCITYKGKTQTFADWARELEINADALSSRIRKGWSEERALTEPCKYK